MTVLQPYAVFDDHYNENTGSKAKFKYMHETLKIQIKLYQCMISCLQDYR